MILRNNALGGRAEHRRTSLAAPLWVAAFLVTNLMVESSVVLADTAAADPAANAEPDFNVWEYRVLGNTMLAATDIESLLYPHLGPGKNLTAVEEVRKSLEALYRDRGFGTVYVDIPEQDVVDGVVRLRVVEGRMDRLRVAGAKYFSNGQIREALSLKRGEVLRLPEVQAALAKLNRQSPDRQLTPVLRAGRTPGTVDVEIKVNDELPLHASAEVNDRYTAETSRTRASVNLSYDNLFQSFQSLSLQYQTAPENREEASVLAATYVVPFAESGNVLAAYAVDSDSKVAAIGTLAVLGKGRIYGTRYIVRLPEAEGYSHTATWGLDYKDFKEDVLLEDDQGLQTPIDYFHWSAVYAGNARTETTSTGLSLGLNFGLRGVGNDPAEFENKRFKAQPNYVYLRANASHERPLFFGTRLGARFAAQYVVDPLISNEQFSIGGVDTVRGYLESEELGDYGAAASIELLSPSFAKWAGRLLDQLNVLTFVDAGIVNIIEPLPQQKRQADLSSWGVGVRLKGFGGLQASLDWASALVPTDSIEAGDSRLHFQMRYEF